MKISANMIVKNEENNIRKSLNSLLGKVDEIIVVDTGSTDNTKDIIRDEYPTVKLFNFTWNNSFADARNFALSKCKKFNDFILYIDADEQLVLTTPNGEFPEDIPKQLLNFDILNETDDGGSVNSVCSRMSPLVKGLQFIRGAHEIFSSPKVNLTIGKCNFAHIKHWGYTSKERNEKNKGERNIELLKIEREKIGPSVSGNFYLGQEYYILNQFERTRDLALEGIKLIDPKNLFDLTFQPLILHALISCYVALNDEKAIKHFEENYLELANNPEVYQTLQNWALNNHDIGKAMYYAFQTLKYTNAHQLPPKFIEKNIRFAPYISLAQYFMNVKQDKLMALYWLEMAHQAGVNDIKLLVDIYNLLPKCERTLDKWEYYNRQIYQQNKDERLLKDLIGCYILSKDENKNKVAMSLANDLMTDEERGKLKINLSQLHKDNLIPLLK